MRVNNNALTMVRGDDEVITVTVSGYELTSADVVTLSVRSLGKVNRLGEISAGPDLQFTKTATIVDGVAVFQIDANDTAFMPDPRYVYDVCLTTSGGKKHTIVPINYFNLIERVSV